MAKKAAKKRKKTVVKRRAVKKSGRKKSFKRKTAKKKTGSKGVSKKKAVRKLPKLPAEPIGRVTHYFPKVRATAVQIERDGFQEGDTLYFKGHTTNFKQKVESLQINHQRVSQASSGDEVGIQTKSRTREHDLVFKL